MILIDGSWFKDEHGRTLLLRGVNLGGKPKVPFRPNGATDIREGFFDHRSVSFVGQPFPLEGPDEHLAPPAGVEVHLSSPSRHLGGD